MLALQCLMLLLCHLEINTQIKVLLAESSQLFLKQRVFHELATWVLVDFELADPVLEPSDLPSQLVFHGTR